MRGLRLSPQHERGPALQLGRCLGSAFLIAFGMAAFAPWTEAQDETGKITQYIYSSVEGIGPLGGIEWQIDAPWRLEPQGGVYDSIPITISFHDVETQDDPFSPPYSFDRFCGLYVMEGSESNPVGAGSPMLFVPSDFYEIEGSKRWLKTGGILAAGEEPHALRRIWRGDTPGDVTRIEEWAEWHATLLYEPQEALEPGDELRLIVVARVSSGSSCPSDLEVVSDRLLWQLMRGRASSYSPDDPLSTVDRVDPNASEFFLGDFLTVHAGESPLPRFSEDWVYGDIHYHSQGTDNEGESATSLRAVAQAIKAMGLDYVFATDHASNSDQITNFHQVFVTDLPDVWWLPDWIEEPLVDFVLDKAQEFRAGWPIGTSDSLRDLSPERFAHLYDWINADDGVNAEVAESGGSSRSPKVYMGAEVDIVPEISDEERELGFFIYAWNQRFYWANACTDLPAQIMEFTNYAEGCRPALTQPTAWAGTWALQDPQGLGLVEPSRQHIVHLPYDSDAPNAVNGRDAFVPSDSKTYGGGNYFLRQVLEDQLKEQQKGYVFLAHPVTASTGDGPGRLGPDIVPYSYAQLTTAFESQYVLGLQLWNSDARQWSFRDQAKYPMLHGLGRPEPEPEGSGLVQVQFDWRWERVNESYLLEQLRDGTKMWDQLLLWGITPSRTNSIPWLDDGAPRKIYMAGGSDAHGDLNYRREGRLLGWEAANDTAIGKPRNLSFVPNAPDYTQNDIVDSLKDGHFSVTDGPALRIAIDKNGNGIIDQQDIPMGGDLDITGDTAPLLVEWKSTPEFGPVKNIDIYIGVQAEVEDGLIYAPLGHGVLGGVTCIDSDAPILDTSGREYCPLADGYVRDMTGRLSFEPEFSERLAGVRRVDINPGEFPLFEHECVTETETINNDGQPLTVSFRRCSAINVQDPERLYVRAFGETEGLGIQMRRYAYTNPIWLRSDQMPSAPNINIVHESCLGGVNTYRVDVAEGIASGTIDTLQYRNRFDADWRDLEGKRFQSSDRTTVAVRARSCTELGCSDFAVQSLVAPTCRPPVPPPPRVILEFASCKNGSNDFLTTVVPSSSVNVDTINEEFRIGQGSWRPLTAASIRAPGNVRVFYRAQACNQFGCSPYATTSQPGPACSFNAPVRPPQAIP